MFDSAGRKRTLLITGSSGYLSQLLIGKLLDQQFFDRIVGLDIKIMESNHLSNRAGKFEFVQCDVRDIKLLQRVFIRTQPDTVLHLAWVFNPVHDVGFQRDVDVGGSRTVFELAASMKYRNASVRKIVYMGSTTAYVNADNPWTRPFIPETNEVSGTPRYLYSWHKAEVDRCAQECIRTNPDIVFTLMRGCIIVGKHTKNIVSQMADWHLPGLDECMFQVKGFNPPMQFLSEEDFVEILFRAVVNDYPGIYNAAGDGVLRYSEMISALNKKPLALRPAVIYPSTEALWRLRLCPFPAGILDLVRYPWVADNAKLKKVFGFVPRKTSREAFEEFAQAQIRRNEKAPV